MVRYVLDDGSRNMKSPWTIDISTTNATALTINTNHVSAVPAKLKNAASSTTTSTALNLYSNDDKVVQVGINSSGHSDSRTGYLWHFDNYDLKFGTNNTERLRIQNGGDIILSTSILRENSDSTNLEIRGGATNQTGGAFITLHGTSDGSGGRLELFYQNGSTLDVITRGVGTALQVDSSGVVNFNSAPTAGSVTTLAAYLKIQVAGTNYYVPYYNP